MKTDNPAGRLLNILREGKEIGLTVKNKEAWCQLLEVDNGDSPLFMYRLGKFMELPEKVVVRVNSEFPSQQASILHWSPKLNSAFQNQNLNGQWKEFISHIDNHTLNYLSMTVDLLDTVGHTKVIKAEELSDIYEKINEIRMEAIESDELDEGFKRTISVYLQKILKAIEEYKISGASPILEGIEQTLGHSFLDESYRNTIQNTDYGKRFLSTLSLIADTTTLSLGLPQLTESIKLFLLAPDQ